ncbi:MAG: polysaccharide deacetylase family protein, partial [Clostridiales bacterium]
MTVVWVMAGLLGIWFCWTILPTCYLKYVRNNTIQPVGALAARPVMLTFDDGPDRVYTPQLLDLLAKEQVKATFFVLSDKVEQYPEVVERIRREGHQIAFHAVSHRNMWFQSYRSVRENFYHGLDVLSQHDCEAAYYRPPYGNINLFTWYLMKKEGLHLMLWTVMAQDWSAKSTTPIILEKLRARTQPGSVICLHDSGEGTGGEPGGPARMMAALEIFLPELKKKNYRFLLPTECVLGGGLYEFHRR